jgi:two-component system, sensor histidine kinase and response regulator
MTSKTENILVVDDNPENLRLLSTILNDRGYKVRKAINGQIAIKTVRMLAPDLILLDINMPQMNGYEVCQIFKADEQTKNIPIIFISALDDVLEKIKAFQVGGADYITKPFQEAEAIARIEHQLTLCRQQRQLQEQNERLQKEIAEREKAENILRVYLRAVSHDLRNPVLSMALVLKNTIEERSSELQASSPQKVVPLAVLEKMENSCSRQLQLIDSLIETQQFEIWGVPLQCQPLQLAHLTQQLASEWQPLLQEKQTKLHNNITSDLPLVCADANQLWRVFENLLANAIKYNAPGIEIVLKAEVVVTQTTNLERTMIRCAVIDNGAGMSVEQAKNLFEIYQRGSQARRTIGLGLGLYLCRQIVNAHQGEIGIITAPNEGAEFWFTLPVA